MFDFSNTQIPPPKNWQDFETLCADLWEKIWNDPQTQKNCRSGQAQHGVDIFGRKEGHGDWHGIQCKGKDALYGKAVTKKELIEEVEKGKKFSPKIKTFILATTAQTDGVIQKEARKLTEKNEKEGLFSVTVLGWDEIQRRIAKHPDLIEIYWPSLYPSNEGVHKDLKKVLQNQADIFEIINRPLGSQGIFSCRQDQPVIPGAFSSISKKEDTIIEKPLHDQIDTYRDLISEKPKTALSLYHALMDKCWDTASKKIKFRITTNIGACYFEINESKKASEYFFKAEHYAQGEYLALCNSSLAFILINDRDNAKKKALEAINNDPDKPDAYSHLLSASDNEEIINNLESFVPKALQESQSVAFTIGQIFYEQNNLSQANAWFKRAFKKKKNRQASSAYAATMLEDIFNDPATAIGGQLRPELTNDFKIATEIFEEIWSSADTEIKPFHISTAINLSNIYRFNNENDKAELIINEVIQISPQSVEARRYAALIELLKGRAENACNHLSTVPRGQSLLIDLMYAEALTLSSKYPEAFAQIESLRIPEEKQDLINNYNNLKLILIFEIEGISAAKKYAKVLENDSPNNIELILNIADIFERANQNRITQELILKAYSKISKSSSYSDKLSVADKLYKFKKYDKALSLYKDLIISNKPSYPLQKLLVCYLNTNQRRAIENILAKMPKEDRCQKIMRRFSASYYFKIGKLDQAMKEAEEYLKIYPNDLDFRLNWITILKSKNDEKGIAEFLKNCPEFTDADPELQMQLAQLLNLYGHEKRALLLAYDLCRKHNRNQIICSSYIYLILIGIPSDRLPITDIVEPNCAVTIEDDFGERKTYIIECDFSDLVLNEEILPSHSLAVLLNGKRKNDTIEYSINPLQKQVIVIKDIKSKYLHLMQMRIQEYSTSFPDNSDFFVVKTKNKENGKTDLSQIFKSIDHRHDHVNQVEKMYQDKKIPIGLLAKFLGVNPLNAWINIMSNTRVRLVCCIGNQVERSNALNLLKKYNYKCVIDPLTLYSMYAFDIHEELLSGLKQIGITQSTLNLFRERIIEFKANPPHMTIGKIGENYIRGEVSKERIVEAIDYLQNVLDWAEKNCLILPAIPRNDIDPTFSKLFELMHPSFLDTILAANGSNSLLLSDDLHYRSFGKEIIACDGVWLQPTMLACVSKKAMSNIKYTESLVGFIDANLFFISINAQFLVTLARIDEWSVSDRFRISVNTLGKQGVDSESAFRVLMEFLTVIADDRVGRFNVESYTYALLNGFRAWRDPNIINRLLIFIDHISLSFSRERINYAISKWCEGHLFPNPFKTKLFS